MPTKTRFTELYLGMAGNKKYANFSGTLSKSMLSSYQASTLLQKHFEYMSKANLTMSLPAKAGTEKIVYSNGKSKFNACEHYEMKAINVPHSYVLSSPSPGTGGVYQYYYRRGMSGAPVVLPSHLTLDYRAASSRAWWTMQPRFEGKISMLNFLYELKDVKELANQAYHILKKLRNLRRFHSHMKSSNKFDLSKPASEIHLTYQFGIKPLISDLSTIWNQLGNIVKDAQEKFQQAGEDAQTRHYSETLADSNNFTYGTGFSNNWLGTGIRTKVVFTATLRYKYGYTMRNGLDAFMKYWGLNGSAESFWEAIPFSFIVDYFVKIGKAIHAMETDPNVHLCTLDYCESIKTTKTHGVHMCDTGSLKFGVIDGVLTKEGLLSGYEAKIYSRRIVPPSKGLYIPQVARPKDDQMLNIAAVLRNFV